MGALLSWLSPRSQPGAPTPAELGAGGAHAALLGARLFRSRASGLLIFHRSWLPAAGHEGAAAHVYLLHGFADHCGRYDALARALAAAGFAVHALDYGGHGQSEGERGYTERFAHWVEDALQLAREVRPAPAGARRFLLGHSTGGTIALEALRMSSAAGAAAPASSSSSSSASSAAAGAAPFFAGAVLSGPVVEGDQDIDTPLNRFLARTLANLTPKLVAAPGVDTRKMSVDPALCALAARDPLNYKGGMKVRVGNEFIVTLDRVRAHASSGALAAPMLVFHAERDRLSLASGSRWLAAECAAKGNADVTLRLLKDVAHEVWFEAGWEALVAETVAWIRARL